MKDKTIELPPSGVGRFTKKPVTIEAIQWTGGNLKEVVAFTGIHPRFHEWFSCWDEYVEHVGMSGGIFKIFTLEGAMKATPGDWIIRGVKGEHYPCKPDIFTATYEPEADRKRRGDPVAWMYEYEDGQKVLTTHLDTIQQSSKAWIPLYAAPQPADATLINEGTKSANPVKVLSDDQAIVNLAVKCGVARSTNVNLNLAVLRFAGQLLARYGQPAANPYNETLVRFCPECGSLGDVPAPHLTCCPDGSHARLVPEKFAQLCHALFKDAIAQTAASVEPVAWRTPKAGIGNGYNYVEDMVGEEERFLKYWQPLYAAPVAAQPSAPDRNETIELLATLLHFIPKDEPEIYRDTERLCAALRDTTPPADGPPPKEPL